MLIKMVKKRTFLILSSLIILLIVYLFPTKKEDKTSLSRAVNIPLDIFPSLSTSHNIL